MEDSNIFINLALNFLIKQRTNESNHLKKLLRNEIDCNFVEEDENSEEESENKFLEDDIRDIKELISKTINVYKDTDEFKEFNYCLKKYSENNPEGYESFIQSLDDKKREKLMNIIQTSRINVQSDKIQFSIPRRIVKIKKK